MTVVRGALDSEFSTESLSMSLGRLLLLRPMLLARRIDNRRRRISRRTRFPHSRLPLTLPRCPRSSSRILSRRSRMRLAITLNDDILLWLPRPRCSLPPLSATPLILTRRLCMDLRLSSISRTTSTSTRIVFHPRNCAGILVLVRNRYGVRYVWVVGSIKIRQRQDYMGINKFLVG